MKYSENFEAIFEAYCQHHSLITTKAFHWFGFSLVIISVLGFCSMMHFYPVGWSFDGGEIGILSMMVGYLIFDRVSALLLAFILIPFYYIGRELSAFWLLTLWGTGWTLQSMGHGFFEKRSPSLKLALQFTLFAPVLLLPDMIQTFSTLLLEHKSKKNLDQ